MGEIIEAVLQLRGIDVEPRIGDRPAGITGDGRPLFAEAGVPGTLFIGGGVQDVGDGAQMGQAILGLLLMVLAVVLAVEGVQTIFFKKKKASK